MAMKVTVHAERMIQKQFKQTAHLSIISQWHADFHNGASSYSKGMSTHSWLISPNKILGIWQYLFRQVRRIMRAHNKISRTRPL